MNALAFSLPLTYVFKLLGKEATFRGPKSLGHVLIVPPTGDTRFLWASQSHEHLPLQRGANGSEHSQERLVTEGLQLPLTASQEGRFCPCVCIGAAAFRHTL